MHDPRRKHVRNRKRRRLKAVGLFGGTFDPPHRGHLFVAREAMRRLNLSRVIFIPAAIPPHKRGRALASPADRLNMVRLAVRAHRRFEVSPVEIRRPGPSFTIDTVRALRRRYPHREMFFLVGTDTIPEIRTWHQYQALRRNVKFVAVSRPGYPVVRGARPRQPMLVLRSGGVNISSTRLRRGLASRRAPPGMLPPSVRNYIARHHLYTDS